MGTASADQFELKDGRTLEGVVLTEEAETIILETSHGITNLPKSDIYKRNGQEIAAPAAPISPANDLPAGDETLLQAALEEKIHEQEPIREHILQQYRNDFLGGTTAPEAFSEKELIAYYEAHRQNFKTQVKLKLKILSFPYGASPEDFEKIRKQPEAATGWEETTNWLTQTGENGQYLGVPEEIARQIFTFKKGEIRHVRQGISDSPATMIVWVTDRQEALPLSFGEAKGKVKFQLLGERLEKEKTLSKDPARLLVSAMRAKTYQNPEIRREIITAYLESKNKKSSPQA